MCVCVSVRPPLRTTPEQAADLNHILGSICSTILISAYTRKTDNCTGQNVEPSVDSAYLNVLTGLVRRHQQHARQRTGQVYSSRQPSPGIFREHIALS